MAFEMCCESLYLENLYSLLLFALRLLQFKICKRIDQSLMHPCYFSGCPKVIIVQACQGVDDNIPEKVFSDSVSPITQHPDELGNDPDEEELMTDYVRVSNTALPPDAADVVLALSTVRGRQHHYGRTL